MRSVPGAYEVHGSSRGTEGQTQVRKQVSIDFFSEGILKNFQMFERFLENCGKEAVFLSVQF